MPLRGRTCSGGKKSRDGARTRAPPLWRGRGEHHRPVAPERSAANGTQTGWGGSVRAHGESGQRVRREHGHPHAEARDVTQAGQGAGGAVGTARTVLSPLGTPSRWTAGLPLRRLRFSPRVGPGGRTSWEIRAAVRVAQRPRRRRPDSAVRAPSGAGDRAPLRQLRERSPQLPPLAARSRLGARCRRPQRTYGATPVAPEAPASSGFLPAIAGFRSVPGDEDISASSPASTIPSLLLTFHFSVEPRGEIPEFLLSQRWQFGSAKASDAQSEGSSPRKDIAAAPGVNSVTRFCEHSENGEALGRGIASLGCVSICGGDPSAPREPSRLRATCWPRSAARAAVAVAVGGAATATIVLPTPLLPGAAGRRSPRASLGKEPFFATARNPREKVFGLPYSKRFCGGKKKHTKTRLNYSNTTSSLAQTVSSGCGNTLFVSRGSGSLLRRGSWQFKNVKQNPLVQYTCSGSVGSITQGKL
ncbi:uncharacterized protein LOC142604454 [Balearica regulorum gibbericeps]|uniref:uncharacterized protein LOC142604454 n=1 Tax=Balearica regulorum gibbericeps TaxID=100784 RepID=UPI003F5FD3C5